MNEYAKLSSAEIKGRENVMSKNELQQEADCKWRLLCLWAKLPGDSTVRDLFLHYRNKIECPFVKMYFQCQIIKTGYADPRMRADGVIDEKTWKSLHQLYSKRNLQQ